MAAPLIPTLPPAPSRADSQDQFSNKADAFVAALPGFGTAANTQAQFTDQRAIDADYSAIEAAAQVALAAEKVQLAETAASIAVGAANYKGEYSQLTTYQVGESVSYLGARYIAKTINTGVTPVSGVKWLPIQSGGQDFILINAGVI